MASRNYVTITAFLTVIILFSLALSFASSIPLASAGSLSVTQEHPFYVNDSWIPAKQLAVGDILQTVDGGKVRITSIEDVVDNVMVYNLHVNGFQNYFANGILVHNKAMFMPSYPEYMADYVSGTRVEIQWNPSKWQFSLESIVIDTTIPAYQKPVTLYWKRTFGALSSNPSKYDLEVASSDFVLAIRKEFPFLGVDKIDDYSTFIRSVSESSGQSLDTVHTQNFQNYLTNYGSKNLKLSELQSAKMLDCTGQALTVLKSLPVKEQIGWTIYRDVFYDAAGVKRLRPHTFLAKQYGENVAIIDISEIMGGGRIKHGFTQTFSEFKAYDYEPVSLVEHIPSEGLPDVVQ